MVSEEADARAVGGRELRSQKVIGMHDTRLAEPEPIFSGRIIYHQITCKRSALERNQKGMSSMWAQVCCAVRDARCGAYCLPLAAACSSSRHPTCAVTGARHWKSHCAMRA